MSNHFSPWRFCIAPMMDWTDRHCRFFHRLLTRHARLYTEMVTTGALIHGDVARHLDFNAEEHPVALQLGGSEPDDLAHCARLAERWGYDEVNLNCGCPSERVQRGAFGACLMAEPELVRDCVKAMVDAVGIPVTVKHRIGIDKTDSYDFVRDFVGTVADGGATVFMVHARSAWLKGLSPKENREIPPLRPDFAQRLKADFPDFTIVLNGGIAERAGIAEALTAVDGVMVGRRAYHDPWFLAQVDEEVRRGAGGVRSCRCDLRDAQLRPAGCGPRRAAARGDAPHAGLVPRPAGRARLAPHAVRQPRAGGRRRRRNSGGGRRGRAAAPRGMTHAGPTIKARP